MANPSNTATPPAASTTPATPKKKRNRKPQTLKLVWVTETAPEKDEKTGKETPGKTCYVEMALPPGLDEKKSRDRESIKRAIHAAVYEQGLEEYGNKDFEIIAGGDRFSVAYEKETVTRLTPPVAKDTKKTK